MKKTPYLIALIVALSCMEVTAQMTISAEVRPRTEFRNGFKTLTEDSKDASFFTEQRSRLYLDYADSAFKFRVSFQDVRIWGETTQIFKEEYGKTFLSEAWGQYYFTNSLSVKVGRQIISYDNQRFIGGLE
ncbi:MAG: alginate export family protein, partial [Cyclobacteriaceae bacterium]